MRSQLLTLCAFLFLVFLFISISFFVLFLFGNQKDYIISVEQTKIFDMYTKKFNKVYSHDEYQIRLSHFKESMKEISYYNSVSGAKHGWTRFTDMSKEELARLMLKRDSDTDCFPDNATCVPNVNKTIIYDDIPDKVDWRTKNAIGPVLDQLLCGCCWAISVVGNMEAMAVARGFAYQQLSVQELIDCSSYTAGCKGGSMRVLEFLCKYKFAVTTEEKYPLKLVDGKCVNSIPGLRKIKEYTVKCDMDEKDILRIIAHYGPVVVVVNPGPMFSYNGGIIQRACARSHDGFSMDHMVQIVGYDLSGDIPYYIVKNSWGTNYGENGYLKLAVYKNMCGLAEEVAYFDVY